MKLLAQVGDAKHSIEITETDGVTIAVVDGEKVEVEISSPEPNVYLIRKDGKIFEAFVSPNADQNAEKQVYVDGREYEVRLTDPKRLRSASNLGGQADGVADIKTAMPGKVVRLLCETGSEIKKGDGVLVVEAMKMQNELKSPKNGVVKAIKVAEGDTVAAGDVLATIE